MERILYSVGAALAIALILYLTAVFFTLTDKVVPVWILGVLAFGFFITALVFDILTSSPPEKPRPRDVDEE